MQPIYLFPDALDGLDVQRLLAAAEHSGFRATGRSYPPSYRDNDRAVIDDDELSSWLFARIGRHLPDQVHTDDGARWQLHGLNRRIRFCRYRDGQAFRIHRDGVHHGGDNERSLLTFMVYLNDSEEFSGGRTRFFQGRDEDSGQLFTIAPRRGMLVAFDHRLWHDGEPVHTGTKWVMRSDVMYRRESSPTRADHGHLGYIWQVVSLADGRVASCGRDGTLRVWERPEGPGPLLSKPQVTPTDGGSLTALVEIRPNELWVGDRHGDIRVWRGGAWMSARKAHDGAILDLIALPDGRVASASADGTVGLWAATESSAGRLGGRLDGRLVGHESWVWSLSARSDGVLLSASEDGSVRSWSLASDAEVGRYAAPAPVRAVCTTRSWASWAGCADGTLLGWHGDRASVHERAHAGAIRALVELPDGRLASAGEDDHVRIFSSDGTAELARHQHADFVTSLASLAGARPGAQLLSGSYDGTLQVWAV